MKWGKISGSFSHFSTGLEGGKEKVVPVVLVFVHHSLEHGFEDLVDSLNLAITLRVIRRGILVFKIQHGKEIFPKNVLKMRTLV